MDAAAIYVKTELGLREIKDRTLNLPVPMRGLLIMIDGNRTVAEILERVKALRLDTSAFEALEVGGLIARKFPLSARASNDDDLDLPNEEDAPRFREAHRLMSEAIGTHLGFRGYRLSTKLNKATNLRDLNELLHDFAAALVRRIGMDAASPIVYPIEALIKK